VFLNGDTNLKVRTSIAFNKASYRYTDEAFYANVTYSIKARQSHIEASFVSFEEFEFADAKQCRITQHWLPWSVLNDDVLIYNVLLAPCLAS
jgi:hypothetical protein